MVKFVKGLDEISKNDILSVGGKAANLGEIIRAGMPVPRGFAVTTEAYRHFLNGMDYFSILEEGGDISRAEEASASVRRQIEELQMPEHIEKEITEFYRDLSEKYGRRDLPVAVRSSATAEDLEDASFAGQQLTLLNVSGERNVLDAVKKCMASAFTARAISYRKAKGISDRDVLMSVVVQKQLDSSQAGVGFTVNPVTGETDRIVIEAAWGQGDSVVSGEVTPDTYIIDKKTLNIIDTRSGNKTRMKTLNSAGGLQETAIEGRRQDILCLPQKSVEELARMALTLESHYGRPQDFEWAMENGTIFLLQARPVTAVRSGGASSVSEETEYAVKGLPASPGAATGTVRILASAKEMGRISPGDILVAKMTSPDFVPAMKIAAGIVTDEGGMTSHAAIVSRELGIPCIVGAGTATLALKENQTATLDAYTGRVYAGAVKIEKRGEKYDFTPTRTKIYVNLGQPEAAEKYSKLACDGIGLMRAEFIAANLGKHPGFLIAEGRENEFVEKIYEGVARVARAFHPRPVVYRSLDFKTNEYGNLEGGEREPVENNPMIGWRGASRYIVEPQEFRLELAAIKKAYEEGLDNVCLMIPFIRSAWELREIKSIIRASGLYDCPKFRLWIMVEVPSTAILIEDFIREGIDGVSIGSNDLTQLTLGVDRDSAMLAERWFNELDPAVLWCIERVVKACAKKGITCSICGQAPSYYPDLAKKLVQWGTTSISVNADAIDKTRHVVAQAEKLL
ncbi:MAG: phosphoenolpyruvate synthase [Candidatus Aenigmarchaeota archaeon]|nr:phosphoenolpyruvate synthase [Candidatus Aenigmarchaeota archaeon]